MRSTLFHIPHEFLGVPVFGFGWLLAVWLVMGIFFLVQSIRQQGWTWDLLGQAVLIGAIAFFIAFVLPALTEAEGLPVRGYGVMLLLATIAAVALAQWRAPRFGLSGDFVLTITVWIFLAGITGARLFYVIEYWERIRVVDAAGNLVWLPTFLRAINLAQGGLVVYGSILGGLAALVVLSWFNRVPFLSLMDLVAPSFMLGLALGRIGCFLNGCCFGAVSDVPWAVRFPAGSLPHLHHVEKGLAYLAGLKLASEDPPTISAVEPRSPAQAAGLSPGQRILAVDSMPTATVADARSALIAASSGKSEICLSIEGRSQPVCFPTAPQSSLPVHPTQLYSSLNALLICLFLLAWERVHRHDGEVAAMMFTIYPVTRFLLEILRDDEPWVVAGQNLGLTIAQVISLLLLGGACLLWFYIFRTKPGLWTVPEGHPWAKRN